jgi:hypothetical protein
MPTSNSQLIVRLGSHAEKEYLEKTASKLDGVLIGANLVEATPGATASLSVKLALSRKKSPIPIYIDPMTYTFGTYRDEVGRARADLDWIKSDQRIRGDKQKRTERRLKRSYTALAARLGGLFARAADSSRAILPNDFDAADATRATCESVIAFQLTRLREEFAKDPEFAEYADAVPEPPFVFAPYFYIDPQLRDEWTQACLSLAATSSRVAGRRPVHAIVCADSGVLSDSAFLDRLVSEIPDTGVRGVWLWLSKFDERKADLAELRAFRDLVERLSAHVSVYNMHGGFFSLLLGHKGMTGISHGVGYGEQKDVLPVIGQSTPTVRYYCPPLRSRVGIPSLQRALPSLGVKTSQDFFAEVCDCVICKGVIGGSIARLAEFGDQHFSTPQSKRLAQTPAAAKRCRYHFLLRRIWERGWVQSSSLSTISETLRTASTTWGRAATLSDDARHLPRWLAALSDSAMAETG